MLEAQVVDAVVKTVGELGKPFGIAFIPRARLGGNDHEASEHFVVAAQGKGARYAVAALHRLFPPRRECGIGAPLSSNRWTAAADGGARRGVATLVVRPGESAHGEQSILVARISHRTDAFLLVVLGVADPRHE